MRTTISLDGACQRAVEIDQAVRFTHHTEEGDFCVLVRKQRSVEEMQEHALRVAQRITEVRSQS